MRACFDNLRQRVGPCTAILRGRITFILRADGSGYDFSAPTRFDKLFIGVVTPRPNWMPYRGRHRGHPGVRDWLREMDDLRKALVSAGSECRSPWQESAVSLSQASLESRLAGLFCR
jgi:hypothetical protein